VIRRLASVAAAAAAIAGAAAVVVPQHAASLASLAAGTVAVVAAIFLVVLAGPLVSAAPSGSTLAVGGERAAPAPLDPQGLRDARRDLSSPAGAALPAPVHRRLRAAAERRLAAHGVDLDDAVRAPGLLGATTWRQLAEPAAPRTGTDRAAVASATARILDDLDRLAPGGNP